jgi:hypothetical protein
MPAPFAGDDLESAMAELTDEQWLNDALGLDRLGKFLQSYAVDGTAGAKPAALEAVDWNVLELVGSSRPFLHWHPSSG